MKKFELTSETKINIFGKKLFRIKALISFGNVEAGETGGWVEKEENVNQSGDAWVSGNAMVYGNAEVSGNADYTTIRGFGTQFRTTTFFRCKDKQVKVSCGCFYGTIPEFREQVKNTRKGKIAEEYLMIADLMEKHFAEEAK
jgi:hypothetical protein